jgi:hypothetical protein
MEKTSLFKSGELARWPLILGDEIWHIFFTPLLNDFSSVVWGSVLLEAQIVVSIQVTGCWKKMFLKNLLFVVFCVDFDPSIDKD